MTSQGQRFRRRALRRGYKVDEVDAFLDRVEATLAGDPIGAPVAAQEVHDVVFRVRFGGYDEWQVDLHLDRVERQLAELEERGGACAPADPRMAPEPDARRRPRMPRRPDGPRRPMGRCRAPPSRCGCRRRRCAMRRADAARRCRHARRAMPGPARWPGGRDDGRRRTAATPPPRGPRPAADDRRAGTHGRCRAARRHGTADMTAAIRRCRSAPT